jgi:hypothetical protein
MSEKSILEQALLQVNTLEEAVKQNAKGILSSVMKQELNDLLKESMEEEEEVAEQPSKDEETDDMSDAESDDDAEENDDMASINDEPSKDIDGEDEEAEDEDSETEAEDDFPTFDDAEEPSMDDDMLDMTNASDEEVLKVFKAMSDEDGIIVKKDGGNISLKDEEDEYIIKLDEEDLSSEDVAEDWNEGEEEINLSGDEEVAEEEEMSDEAIYEIELDGMDDEMGDEEVYEVSGTPDDLELPEEEVEVDEAAHTKWNAHGGDRAGLPTKKMFAAGAKKTTNESAAQKKAINEEVQNLKKQNAEYKKALVLFKEKLNEVAVFNANLAYATRLFTEHSTTKSEKLNILKRFDSISTITESKNLYNSINAELGTKKPVTESVAEKISSTPSSSSSEVLSESKVYEAPQFARMKDLMKKIK